MKTLLVERLGAGGGVIRIKIGIGNVKVHISFERSRLKRDLWCIHDSEFHSDYHIEAHFLRKSSME